MPPSPSFDAISYRPAILVMIATTGDGSVNRLSARGSRPDCSVSYRTPGLGTARRSVAVVALAAALVRALAVALRVPVLIVVIPVPAAPSHLGVDGDEVPVVAAHFDDALGRDVVVLAEELQFHQVHHVSVGQDDGSPFLPMLLLVVAERASIRRPTHDCDGDVVD